MEKSEIEDIEFDFKKIIDEKLPEIDTVFSDTAIKLDPEILKFLNQFVNNNAAGIFKGELNLSLILDSNTVLSCVRSKFLNKRESILVEISKNPMISIYYSDYVKEEVVRNIKKGRLSTKNKKLDTPDVVKYADDFLENFIHIKNHEITQHPNSEKLKERDPKDVPILNLTSSKDNHGILTLDGDFAENPEIKTWTIKEFGETTCMMNKGAMAVCFLSLTTALIVDFIKFLLNILKTIITFVIDILKSIVTLIASISPAMLLTIGGVALIALISFLKEDDNEFETDIKALLKSFEQKFNRLFNNVSNLLKSLNEKEEVKLLGKGLMYLLVMNTEMMKESERINSYLNKATGI